jgi:4-amino-4-deoxy-L-arabinose transferase-like glycosyltransferase
MSSTERIMTQTQALTEETDRQVEERPVARAGEPAPGTWRRALVPAALVAILAMGFVFRFDVAAQRAGDEKFEFRGDERSYYTTGILLLRGEFFPWPGRAPGYPLFIAGLYGLIENDSPIHLLYMHALLGTGVIGLTYLMARRLAGPWPAVLAAGIVAIDARLIEQVGTLYSEILYTPLQMLAMAALLAAVRRPTWGWLLATGLMLGLCTITRPAIMLFPLMLPLLWPREWRWKARILRALGVGAVMALVCLPFTLNNLARHGRLIPVSLSTAVLWQGSPEYYKAVQSGRRASSIWANELNPKKNGGHDPFSIEGGDYFNARAKASIRAEPLVYLEYCLKKPFYLWFGNGFSDMSYIESFDWKRLRGSFRMSRFETVCFMFTRQLPWIALLATGVLIWRGGWRPLVPVYGLMIYFTVTLSIVLTGLRFSDPLRPFLAMIIACGVAALWRTKAGEGALARR